MHSLPIRTTMGVLGANEASHAAKSILKIVKVRRWLLVLLGWTAGCLLAAAVRL